MDHSDATSPIDYIRVDYDKPTAHPFIDALLESRPPAKKLSPLLDHVKPYLGNPISVAFRKYTKSKYTSYRHQRLAGYALQVYDACNVITSIPGLKHYFSSTNDMRTKMLSSLHRQDSGGTFPRVSSPYSVKECAVMIGLAMTNTHSGEITHEDGSFRSPWLCASHRAEGIGGSQKEGKSCHTRATSTISLGTQYLEPRSIAMACANYSTSARKSPCDASEITFEIPDVGFRLTLRNTTRPAPDYPVWSFLRFFTSSQSKLKVVASHKAAKPIWLDVKIEVDFLGPDPASLTSISSPLFTAFPGGAYPGR